MKRRKDGKLKLWPVAALSLALGVASAIGSAWLCVGAWVRSPDIMWQRVEFFEGRLPEVDTFFDPEAPRARSRFRVVDGDGKPVPVPGDMAKIIGQPSWIAMDTTAIALGVGTGEQGKLSASLKNPPGTPGQLMRMHLSGAMYLDWLQLMETKFDAFAARKAGQPAADATFAHSKAQFATMKAQAARIQSVDAEVHVDHDGLVTTSQTILK